MANKILYVGVIAIVCGLAMIAIADAQGDKPVTDICLGCIREAISAADPTCTGDVCGYFRITRPYWADGGNLTVNGEAPTSETAYPNCVNDLNCAANTFQNYMAKFSQDCNGDNVVDCYDYAAIHLLGAYGCNGDLSDQFLTKLNTCMLLTGINVRSNFNL